MQSRAVEYDAVKPQKPLGKTIEPHLQKGLSKNHAGLLEEVNVRLADEMLTWNEAALKEIGFLVLHVHGACYVVGSSSLRVWKVIPKMKGQL